MKKLTILTALIGLSLGVKAQTGLKIDSLKTTSTLDSAAISNLRLFGSQMYIRAIETPPSYRDTLNCLINTVDTISGANKWVKAKIVYNGGLHNPTSRTTWTNGFTATAIGPFSNKFISDTDLTGLVIMQVSITDKNPYKTTK